MTDFWTTALLAPLEALARQMLELLPNVLATVIIFAAGLAIAWVLGNGVERFFRAIGLDHLCNRLGLTMALIRGGVKYDPSHLAGRGVYWVVLLSATIAALGALNLQPINQFAQSFLAYMPHLFVAALILLAGFLLSNFISQAVLIAAVNANLRPARIIAAASRWGVQLVSVAMALEQLGIARNIVVVGFGITLGGLVLAASIAFGLGAKDLAKEYLEQRFSHRRPENGGDDLRHL